MSKILWVNSKTQTITKKNRNKKMAKNMLAPSFPTYRLSVSPSLFYHSDSSIPRLHSLQGLFCSGLWNVVLVLQKQDLHLCVKSFTAQWELRQTKKRPSHTHTHTDLTVLESDGISMYVNSAWLSVLTIQSLFSCLWVVI